MAFDRTGQSSQSQRGFDSRIVPLEPLGTMLQLDAGAGTAGLEPGIEVSRLSLANHRGALLHQLLHVGEFAVLLEQQPGELAGYG